MQHNREQEEVDESFAEIVRVSGRFTYVLLATLSFIAIYPAVIDAQWGRILMLLLGAAIVVAVARAVGRSRRQLIVVTLFAASLLGLQVIYLATGSAMVFRVGAATLILFLAFAIAQIFTYLMRQGPITADKLHAALTIYLLAAFFWASVYTLFNQLDPGSFIANNTRVAPIDFYDMLYFSFTTLTSTGYGDLTPATRRAESLTVLEQVAGVFYVAVLIARLSGVYPPRGHRAQ